MPTEDMARPDDRDMALAKQLESLANPTRLALLRELRHPRLVGEIRIRAEQAREGLPDLRPMARQGVRLHLDRLLESGFAQGRAGWRGESQVEEYLVQHQRLFALAEEVRQLGVLRPEEIVTDGETSDLRDLPAARLPRGRSLVIVHGLGEGTAFPLAQGGEWFIGRQSGLAASLDYDPFVSSRHARVFVEGERAHIESVVGNRNGTFVNWSRIKDGAAEPLRHGDVIGVGKSLLLFRE